MKKEVSGASAESLPVRPLAGSLSMPMAVCGGGTFHRSSRKAGVNCAQRRR